MANINVTFRIDEDIKHQADDLFLIWECLYREQ